MNSPSSRSRGIRTVERFEILEVGSQTLSRGGAMGEKVPIFYGWYNSKYRWLKMQII
jgi:hypothetical protein